MRSGTEEENEDREVEARPENNETEEARREVVESPRILLAIHATLLDDYNVVIRAIEAMDSAAMVVTSFLQFS